MKLYKDYAKEKFSFLLNNATLLSDDPLKLKKTTYDKMTVGKKIKTIEQNKAQYNLDRQAAKISAADGNVNKYEFLTGKHAVSEKRVARKSCYNQKI